MAAAIVISTDEKMQNRSQIIIIHMEAASSERILHSNGHKRANWILEGWEFCRHSNRNLVADASGTRRDGVYRRRGQE